METPLGKGNDKILIYWLDFYMVISYLYITQNSICAQKYVFKIIWQIRHFLSLSSN